ncbi:DUF6508 domain-containing protein [Clostridium sp. HBUAS56010]|uniref:DUF6508 domain-containing protein n=1 Tax=Clostridium sp. HBUAS56010 TaxID=2571127 RepID=UPI001178964D|nr:DUF6508 domain-containing protein [Clostridium sp. HBUAS56010]
MYGSWVIDTEHDGTAENPIQMPFVNYTNLVRTFIHDLYAFIDENKEMELKRYGDILNKNGINLEMDSIKDVEVRLLDAPCIMALIVGAIRAERFCEGVLLDFFLSGSIAKWLKRLKDIDSGK